MEICTGGVYEVMRLISRGYLRQNVWHKWLSCKAYLGKGGLSGYVLKVREGVAGYWVDLEGIVKGFILVVFIDNVVCYSDRWLLNWEMFDEFILYGHLVDSHHMYYWMRYGFHLNCAYILSNGEWDVSWHDVLYKMNSPIITLLNLFAYVLFAAM